jgi:hypothetical protein
LKEECKDEEKDRYQEEKKILVGSCPNAIDDPNAMMIHLKNTPLTYNNDIGSNNIRSKT